MPLAFALGLVPLAFALGLVLATLRGRALLGSRTLRGRALLALHLASCINSFMKTIAFADINHYMIVSPNIVFVFLSKSQIPLLSPSFYRNLLYGFRHFRLVSHEKFILWGVFDKKSL